MNILYINHYAGGPSFGMEFRTHYLAREWVRAGHSVMVVAADYSHLRSMQPQVKGRFTKQMIDGVSYIWCQTPPYARNGVKRFLNILAFVRALMRPGFSINPKPDVIIASSTYPFDMYPAARLARRSGSLLVWEVHDLWPMTLVDIGGMPGWHPFVLLVGGAEKYACRTADVVVSLLRDADQHLTTRGMTREKYFVVPNGIDATEWKNTTDVLPEEHLGVLLAAKSAGLFRVGYAGHHGLANGLDVLLSAAERLREKRVHFFCVGSGPEKQALMARSESLGLKNISFLSSVPKTSVGAFLSEMDVLYAGFRNARLYRFGVSLNKVMDYMMAAKPIVYGLAGSYDVVSAASCGVTVSPGSGAEVAEAIERLLNMSKDERTSMGQRGRTFVEAHHSYQKLAQHFIDILKQAR